MDRPHMAQLFESVIHPSKQYFFLTDINPKPNNLLLNHFLKQIIIK